MNNKLTRLEKQWILYDVANSAFILFATSVIPIVFNQLAANSLTEDQYFAYWGYAITAATVVVGLLGPILGALSDRTGKRKLLFTISVLMGVIGCALMPFFNHWLVFLITFILTKSAYNASLVFYDSMLPDITPHEKLDVVSSHGYAWGYVGSTIPFIASIAIIFLYDKIGLTLPIAMALAFILNAAWWLVLSLPLIRNYKQPKSIHPVTESQVFHQLMATFKEIGKNKKVALYLLAFVFFIDGVYTMINMATAYGTSLGLSSNDLILALLVTQFVAFPCALFFSKISKRFKTESLIKVCIAAYGLISLYAIQLNNVLEFWMLAIAVGMFQGAIQALSRSYYAKIIPKDKSGEYFGIFDICGKGASIMGTFIVSLVSQITGSQQIAVATLSLMFLIGYVIFNLSLKEE